MPLANAIEGALCVDGISLHGISLPETSLHCTQALHFFKCLFTVLPEGQMIGSCANNTVLFAPVGAHFLDCGCFEVLEFVSVFDEFIVFAYLKLSTKEFLGNSFLHSAWQTTVTVSRSGRRRKWLYVILISGGCVPVLLYFHYIMYWNQ